MVRKRFQWIPFRQGGSLTSNYFGTLPAGMFSWYYMHSHVDHYIFGSQWLTGTTASIMSVKVVPPVLINSLTIPVAVQMEEMAKDVSVSEPRYVNYPLPLKILTHATSSHQHLKSRF